MGTPTREGSGCIGMSERCCGAPIERIRVNHGVCRGLKCLKKPSHVPKVKITSENPQQKTKGCHMHKSLTPVVERGVRSER